MPSERPVQNGRFPWRLQEMQKRSPGLGELLLPESCLALSRSKEVLPRYEAGAQTEASFGALSRHNQLLAATVSI